MQIQFNTDYNVEGHDALAQQVTAEIENVLGRFSDQLTRIEVHLSDENADKSGGADKRCLMEARPTGRQPMAVTHQAGTLEEAYRGAARKLRSMAESTFGKLEDQKGAASIRDNEHR
jgi:hypothetical protein